LVRDPGRVLYDVENGYITKQAAQTDYGVVLTDSAQEIDLEATKALRLKMRAASQSAQAQGGAQ
jgi:N-methylhydantoinase B/oxoprolinase/acetone carboxylase alpha subunit